MARLVLGVAGAVVGGMIGGPTGAKIGWAIGSTVGAMADQPNAQDTFGPRLGDLSVQSSALGAPIPSLHGTMRLAGNIIWSEGIKEHRKEEESGSKGGGASSTQITYTYTCTFAVSLCEGEINGVRRIWADSKLIFDASSGASASSVLASGSTNFDVYLGTETQDASSAIQADKGMDNTPAHRGLAYIVMNDLQLEKYGNRIPNITCEVVKVGAIIPVYASQTQSGTTLAENVYHVNQDGSGCYFISAEWYSYNKKITVKNHFWSPGGSPVEIGRKVYDYLGNSIYPYLPLGYSDEPGYFTYGNISNVYKRPVYTNPDGAVILFPHEILPGNKLFCVKHGDNFWFSYYRSGTYYLFRGTTLMASPATGLGITVVSFGKIRASESYLFVFCGLSVNGPAIVRYDKDSLEPMDYILVPGIIDFDVSNEADITYFSGAANEVKIHREFSALVTDAIAVPDQTFSPATAVHNWMFKIIGDGAYISYIDNGQLTEGLLTVGHLGVLSSTVDLSGVVSSLCSGAGLDASEVDVSELNGTVLGYVRSRPMTTRAALEPLLSSYSAVGFESDFKIKFKTLNGATSKSIPQEHLAAHEYGSDQPDDILVTRQQEQELPRRISVAFVDPDSDYQQGLQHAQRISS